MTWTIWVVLLAGCERPAVDVLEADNAALVGRVADLEALAAAQADLLVAMEARVATLEAQMSATATPEQVAWIALVSQGLDGQPDNDGTTLLALEVRGVDTYVEGANLVVRSADPDPTVLDGTGNLIVGWNRTDGAIARNGTNNLVVGDYHSYQSYGGLLSGFGNTLTAPDGAALGGAGNVVSGQGAAVVGGAGNEAQGVQSVTTGGSANRALGPRATVGGGQGNSAGEPAGAAADQHVAGGYQNQATGAFAVVTGGNRNEAAGEASVVVGGYGNVLLDGATNGVLTCGTLNRTDDPLECSESVYTDD